MNDQVTSANSIAGQSLRSHGNADSSASKTSLSPEVTLDSTKRFRMPMNTRRAHARAYREEPVQYAIYNAKKFHDATMYNESTGGMYFETEMRIAPGTDICIRIPQAVSKEANWTDNVCAARVRWCRQLTSTAQRRFGVGVQYQKTTTQ